MYLIFIECAAAVCDVVPLLMYALLCTLVILCTSAKDSDNDESFCAWRLVFYTYKLNKSNTDKNAQMELQNR